MSYNSEDFILSNKANVVLEDGIDEATKARLKETLNMKVISPSYSNVFQSKGLNILVCTADNADNFADSLSAQNIVNKFKAKLILVNENTDIAQIIKDNNINKVFIVGGEDAVSNAIESEAKENSKELVRISGKNRYETNMKALEIAGYDKVAVADGRNFADALGSSALQVKNDIGLRIVDGSKPYSESRKVLYTYGGENSVKQNGGKRLAGKSRFETNQAINKEIGNVDTVTLVSGKDFPDALSSINIVKAKGSCLII